MFIINEISGIILLSKGGTKMKSKKAFTLLFSLILLLELLVPIAKVQAEGILYGFREKDQFYDYSSVATVSGQWGANLFEGNDREKKFLKILPKNSQWQVYGYTSRYDGFYYWAGGDLWIQAKQVRVPVYDDNDALLSTVTRYHDENEADSRWHVIYHGYNSPYGNYWGDRFWEVKDQSIFYPQYFYHFIVYPNGDAYQIDIDGAPFN